MIKKYLIQILNFLNGDLYCLLRNIQFKLANYPIRVKFKNKNYIVLDGNSEIVLATKVRSGRYSKGIDNLINKLASVYFLDQIKFNEYDVFIDCGANIGEIGMWLNKQNKQIQYISYEPSTSEFKALCLNVPNGKNNKKALWNENKTLEFYLDVNNADSSLIYNGLQPKKMLVEAVRLDSYLVDIEKIKVLKIEAEGGEPEVLVGCEKILHSCEYVVVEAGGERGPDSLETVNEVTEYLLSKNFSLVDKFEGRLVCLFINNNFNMC